MAKLSRLFFVALLGAFLITGCAARGVRIAELKDQPDKYDDKLASYRNPKIAQYYLKPVAGKPFETVAVFVVPSAVASSVRPTITWATKLPQYLEFPR